MKPRSETPQPERVTFLGSSVDSLTADQAVEAVDRYVGSGGVHVITVTNANKLWLLRHDDRLRAAYERSDLIVPEWAVVWGAARLGTRLRGMVAGISLLRRLLDEAPARGWSVFFLGAKPDVVRDLVERVRVRLPGLRIAGWRDGYFPQADDAAVADTIRQAAPDVLFVAMGSPRQEQWIARFAATARAKVSLGVGGSFDVLAGRKPDTPSWLRGTGFEWLFRLLLNPRGLWKRYLVTNTWFVWSVMREKARLQRGVRVAGR